MKHKFQPSLTNEDVVKMLISDAPLSEENQTCCSHPVSRQQHVSYISSKRLLMLEIHTYP